ncbi:hypothetical protein CITRIK5_70150 [Citricoccus sp. K5]|nr:hypothetical protein CITRIK5_70150 [Citricoccus sp. K5]
MGGSMLTDPHNLAEARQFHLSATGLHVARTANAS